MRRIELCAAAAIVAAFVWCEAGPAQAQATWVVRGAGFGHGVGMSQYGADGYAKHGRGYRWILEHYYRHTQVKQTSFSGELRVLLGTAQTSVPFTHSDRACGRKLGHDRTYELVRSGSNVLLTTRHGRKLRNCGGSATASGSGPVRIFGDRDYRGDLTVDSSGGELLVINDVGLEDYVRGVVPNEMPSSWPPDALRAQAVAARSYALAVRRGGIFDLYDDTRDQAYGGMDTEAAASDAAVRKTAGEVVTHNGKIATTYYFSSSGGQTENVEYAFPGSDPQPYLKSVRDRYDGLSPDHRWKVDFSQSEMESSLQGLFSGTLRRIRVTKTGVSPRIVTARVIGTKGSSKVSGPTLQDRLGLRSTWARFRRR